MFESVWHCLQCLVQQKRAKLQTDAQILRGLRMSEMPVFRVCLPFAPELPQHIESPAWSDRWLFGKPFIHYLLRLMI